MGWEDILRAPFGNARTETFEFGVINRKEREWLVLPRDRRCAAQTLALYAAQRTSARIAKSSLGLALRLNVPMRRRKVQVAVDSPFSRFLASVAGTTPRLPVFGILAGNPKTIGTRYAFLVFDSRRNPCAVVKAGCSENARALIRHEADFLAANCRSLPGLPVFLSRMESEDVAALATAFVGGKSPPPNPPPEIADILSRWIQNGAGVSLQSLAAWRRLDAAAKEDPAYQGLASTLAERRVHPVVWHGDFTPWNVKVTPAQDWIAVDCERSELRGVPGWNWLHYVVQSGILIDRLTTPALVARVNEQMSSDAFRGYARATQIAGIERQILLSYLIYLLRVLKPAKGLAEVNNLLAAMSAP